MPDLSPAPELLDDAPVAPEPPGEPGSSDVAPPAKPTFRGDVDGLRAVAIVLVVAFHAALPFSRGGFIGVDVFFVISGYLITRNLLAEGDGTGRIALGGFWARRVRRLVPALGLLVLATLVAGMVILPAFDRPNLARQGLAAALYISNFTYATDANDYFAADISASPFLQTWSLGVEEQFYLVWPVLFALACRLGRRRGGEGEDGAGARRGVPRRPLIAGLAVLAVASFGLAVVLTADGNAWAFYSLPTRAWEFAVAGILAAVRVPRWLRGVGVRTGVAVFGFALLAVATRVISNETIYPGAWPLLPVVATLALIASGDGGSADSGQTVFGRLLSLAPMQWLGRVSYSWYLWHWPAIVLVTYAVTDSQTRVKAAAALASLPVAWLTYRFFETPVRFHPRLVGSVRRTLIAGAMATVLIVGVSMAIDATAPADARASGGPRASLDSRLAEAAEKPKGFCAGMPSADFEGTLICEIGDKSSATAVLITGDSHAQHWVLALDDAGKQAGVKVIVRWQGNCLGIPLRVWQPKEGEAAIERCAAYRASTSNFIRAEKPAGVIISQSDGVLDRIQDDAGNDPDERTKLSLWRAAFEEALAELEDQGIKAMVIRDNPRFPASPLLCVERNRSAEACGLTRSEGLELTQAIRGVQSEVLEAHPEVEVFDPVDVLCNVVRCEVEAAGEIAYRDKEHLATPFTRTQIPTLVELLRSATR